MPAFKSLSRGFDQAARVQVPQHERAHCQEKKQKVGTRRASTHLSVELGTRGRVHEVASLVALAHVARLVAALRDKVADEEHTVGRGPAQPKDDHGELGESGRDAPVGPAKNLHLQRENQELVSQGTSEMIDASPKSAPDC